MTAHWRTACALALAAALLAACGTGAPPSKKERKPEIILRTKYDDRRAGMEGDEAVRAAVGLVESPELGAYVDAVGQRLVRNAPSSTFKYRFGIVDQDAPNAFALPGGYIYVSRGLLTLANSEDELANVIGHEIIHVAARHAAARQHLMRGIPKLFAWLQMGSFASYSRAQEQEADRLGQGLAGLAGYDPEGMATFLRDLEFTERLRLGSSRLPGFLDTHPGTRTRAGAASARAARITWTRRAGVASSREDYLRRIDGLAVGTSAKEGVFQGSRFVHPDLGFTMRFPDGWETHNTRQAVGAVSPRRDAQVFLEFHGKGSDLEQAAAEHLEEYGPQGLQYDHAQPIRLAGYDAYRVNAHAGSMAGPINVLLTFIAGKGGVYKITGMARGRSDSYEGVFLSVARSFRPLTGELARSVQEERLRIVEARGGESLTSLSQRTGNRWAVQRTAVMNDMFADQRLESGQLVKIAVVEDYRPTQTAVR